MNILIIDTSTSVEIVAAVSGKSFSDQTREVFVSHSATLFESIDKALNGVNIKLNDLNVIGVGIGPGSFTGIRIAVSTARMLSQIFNLPLVGIKSQLLYAYSAVEVAENNDNILIAFDAKREKVFGALYRKDKELIEIKQPGDYKIEDLLDGINTVENTLLIGNGCEKFQKEIKVRIPKCREFFNYIPSGEIICSLVKNIYLENPDNYNNYNTVVPFYSRASDAEISKKFIEK